MDKSACISALGALAHETRLDVFRSLVKAGQSGLLPGEISQDLGVLQNTLSTHLAILHRAGLVTSRREGRTIRYMADMDGMRSCLGYLMEDCCGGQPELCRPILTQLACAC